MAQCTNGDFGETRDIRVYGDFDGDGKLDYAFFRPTNGCWYVRFFAVPNTLDTLQFGLPADIPVPADYNGDGLTDYAVWRPSTGAWHIFPTSTQVPYSVQFGLPTDIPVVGVYDAAQCVSPGVPAGCLTHPKANLVVFRPSNSTWYITPTNGGNGGVVYAKQWGLSGDVPITGDWDGDGKQDLAVWRPSNGTFYIIPSGTPSTSIQKQWGLPGDTPLPANYDLNTAGKTGYGVFRPTEGNMYFQLATNSPNPPYQAWGPPNGGPPTNLITNQISLCEAGKSIYVRVEGDFDGDGLADFAFYRPSDGLWFIVPSSNPHTEYEQFWGAPGDVPVPADYDGDGRTDIAVWRPAQGNWYILPSTGPAPVTPNLAAAYTRQWGVRGDIPKVGDFDGDGKADFAVWRPGTGTWWVSLSTGTAIPGTTIIQGWGLQGDIPVSGDFDGDGKTDYAVWRPSNGNWYVIRSSAPQSPVTFQWGVRGDLPVAADFTGDHRADFAVWRPSTATWLINPTSGGASITIPLGFAQNSVMYAQPPITTHFISPDVRENLENAFPDTADGPIACEAH